MKFHLLPVFCIAAIGIAGCAQQAPTTTAATTPAPQPRTPVTPTQEVGSALNNQIQVNFAPGSERLAVGADHQLDIAARLFRDVRPVKMFSTGYSDARGDEYSNLVLAARRARAVKYALVARGIPADQILLRSYGESDPVDKENPDAADNRRVVVTWQIL